MQALLATVAKGVCEIGLLEVILGHHIESCAWLGVDGCQFLLAELPWSPAAPGAAGFEEGAVITDDVAILPVEHQHLIECGIFSGGGRIHHRNPAVFRSLATELHGMDLVGGEEI